MLKDAGAAGVSAPASLNGSLLAEPEGWIAKQRRRAEEDQGATPETDLPSGTKRPEPISRSSHNSADTQAPSPLPSSTPTRGSIDSSASSSSGHVPSRKDSQDSTATTVAQNGSRHGVTRQEQENQRGVRNHRHRVSIMPDLNPSPAKPITAKDNLTVSARGAGSLRPSTDTIQGEDVASSISVGLSEGNELGTSTDHQAFGIVKNGYSKPRLGEGTSSATRSNSSQSHPSRLTISSLLERLADIHDKHQKERTSEWDVFLKRRAKYLGSKAANNTSGHGHGYGHGHGGSSSSAGAGGSAGILGVNQMAEEEVKVLRRLVRGGIPLVYRSDVWAGEWFGFLDIFPLCTHVCNPLPLPIWQRSTRSGVFSLCLPCVVLVR